MAIKFNLTRKKIFHHKDGDSGASFTFDFPVSEDVDWGTLRKKMESAEEVEVEVEGKKKVDKGSINGLYYILRTALVGVTGIVDEDEKPYLITKEDGSIDTFVQKGIFEYVKNEVDLFEKVMATYGALSAKN